MKAHIILRYKKLRRNSIELDFNKNKGEIISFIEKIIIKKTQKPHDLFIIKKYFINTCIHHTCIHV